jgi:hypothetical protein
MSNFSASGGSFTYGASQPRKVTEKKTEREFDDEGRCVRKTVTVTERWMQDTRGTATSVNTITS